MSTLDSATSSIKGYVRLSAGGNNVVYQITDLTNNSGWWSIDITYTTSSASFQLWDDDANIEVSFITNGDKGSKGEMGYQGYTGYTGFQGFTGFQGYTGYTGFKRIQEKTK